MTNYSYKISGEICIKADTLQEARYKLDNLNLSELFDKVRIVDVVEFQDVEVVKS